MPSENLTFWTHSAYDDRRCFVGSLCKRKTFYAVGCSVKLANIRAPVNSVILSTGRRRSNDCGLSGGKQDGGKYPQIQLWADWRWMEWLTITAKDMHSSTLLCTTEVKNLICAWVAKDLKAQIPETLIGLVQAVLCYYYLTTWFCPPPPPLSLKEKFWYVLNEPT